MVRSLANTIPLGTSDVIGFNARVKDYVLAKIKMVYERYGFEPLYTPIIENAEVFNGHHGEGEKLLFNLKDKQGEELVLKYDSTVPLARVVSMHPEIPKPYKRYQLQESFRDDDVDKGHFREFIQCDGDIVGADTFVADAEIAMIAYEGLSEIGFSDFTIRLNHRKIIHGIAEKSGIYSEEGLLQIQRAIDYADKVIKTGVEGIKKDLERRQIADTVITTICDLVQKVTDDPFETLDNIQTYLADSKIALEGIRELREILSYIPENMRKAVRIDFTLARGADYYTGFIIEAVINNIELGAVLGGGRFDNLVEAFCDDKIPAVGMAFGLERIITAMEELELTEKLQISPQKVLIMDNAKFQHEIVECASKLRNSFDVSILYGLDHHCDVEAYARHCNYGAVIAFRGKNELIITMNAKTPYALKLNNALIAYGYNCMEEY